MPGSHRDDSVLHPLGSHFLRSCNWRKQTHKQTPAYQSSSLSLRSLRVVYRSLRTCNNCTCQVRQSVEGLPSRRFLHPVSRFQHLMRPFRCLNSARPCLCSPVPMVLWSKSGRQQQCDGDTGLDESHLVGPLHCAA